MDLKERVTIITGGAGAIGRGIGNTLADEGMHVVVADLTQDKCDRSADEIKASGGKALGVAVDVTSRESIDNMVQTVIEAFGRIDVLVNNAGVIVAAPLLEHTEEDFDRVIRVNLKGAFLCAQAVLPYMIKNKIGRIINISSVAAKRPAVMQSAYCASKHGLIGLTQVWCQELAPHNITVNAVCPGFIQSDMWKDHLSPAYAPIFGVDASQLIETIAKTFMPLGTPQQPEDIGAAVSYLCKADNSTGEALVVDGGYSMW